VDLKNQFVSSVLQLAISKFTEAAESFFDYTVNVQKGLFLGLLFSSMIIFFIVMQINILALNRDIWKSKRLLALYPICKITQNMKNFKSTLAKLS